ncbi:hypothetical protein Hanom_Chr03g00272721 [Helianthus anomalus]
MAISVMASDIIMQVLFIFTLIFMFLWTLNISQNLFNNFRSLIPIQIHRRSESR